MNIEMIEEEAPSTALTVQDRAALALGSSKVREDLLELVQKSKDVLEINSRAGREECHSYAMDLVKARTTITKTGKAARDDAVKFSKAVVAEEDALISITEPEEKRLLALRDGWDAKVAAEKAERERLERVRITAIHARIASVYEFAVLARECRTSERMGDQLTKLNAMWVTFNHEDDFEEFGDEAQTAYDETHRRISELVDQKITEETERARAKAEQDAAAAALKAEREAQALEAKKLAEERAALAAEQAAFQAQLAKHQAKEEARRAELAKIAAEMDEPAEVAPVAPVAPAEVAHTPIIALASIAAQPRMNSVTDIQIVECLAMAFNVHESEVLVRLTNLNITALWGQIESEFTNQRSM